MLEICAIASGSNGNCYYIGNEEDAILIDAGISFRQIVMRMSDRGLEHAKIKAVFISHEHSDHIRGARVLAKKLNIPVWITAKTYRGSYQKLLPESLKFFVPGTEIKIGKFIIYPFLKKHDAIEPCSFRIEYNGKSVGILTDIGEPCNNVTYHLKKCNALFLETNYDDQMLTEGPYPYFLKKRITSQMGHLSNSQALNLLKEHMGDHLKCVFLSHLSAENNTPELALNALNGLKSDLKIQLTSRSKATEIFVL